MVGHRYYNPEWGRWIQPDDIEYLDPTNINGLNLYAYCNNDPVNYFDPDGHSAIALLIAFGLGALIGGVTAGYKAYKNGEEGAEFWLDVLGGALIGGALGLASGVGGLVGVGKITGWYIAEAFLGTSLLSFGAGAAGYYLQHSSEENFSYDDMWKHGGITALQSIFNFGMGCFAGANGNWSNIGDGTFSKIFKDMLLNSSKGKLGALGMTILEYGRQFGVSIALRSVVKSGTWWLLNQF